MEYLLIRDESAFLDERDRWTQLYTSMDDATPFQTWEWNYYWWKHNEKSNSLFVIKAINGKEVCGYAPLVVENRTVRFIGGRDMDYGRFVVRTREIPVIEGFVDLILKSGYDMQLQEMASRNEQLHIVEKLIEKKRHVYVRKTTRAVYIDLTKYGNYESYKKTLSTNAKNSVRQMLKRVDANQITIKVEPADDDTLKKAGSIFLDRQRKRGGSVDFSWATTVMKDLSSVGLLALYFVYRGDEPIAFMAVMNGKTGFYTWLMAFTEDSSRIGAGQLLNYQVILDSFAGEYQLLDFMRGDYDFKMRWECEVDTNYSVYCFQSYLRYMKTKAFHFFREAARKTVYGNKTLLAFYKKAIRRRAATRLDA